MGKNVFVISASPRRGGNSDVLCDQFIAGAKEAGHQTEKLFVKDVEIHYCMGCGACMETHACAIEDDMAAVQQKMIDADVIVLATPVYFYSMDAQLKTLIDRTAPRYTEMGNKDFYFILAAADEEKLRMNRTVEGLRGFTEDCLEDAREKGILYGLGVWKVGEIQNKPAMREAFEMGKSV